MSLSVTIIESVQTPNGPLSRSKQYTASGGVQVSQSGDDAVPIGDDFQINVALDVSAVTAFYLSSDQDVTVDTNSTGSPANTINLVANVPYIWTTDSYNTFKLTVDVTKLYISNDSDAVANMELVVLQDATPP